MLANPCTGARWRDSPLGIHRGSGPGHKSHKGARWHLGQRGCSRPGRPSLLERAFDPRKAFKKGTGVRGGTAPRQPLPRTREAWPQGVCGTPEAQITARSRLKSYRTARSAILAIRSTSDSTAPKQRQYRLKCREVAGVADGSAGSRPSAWRQRGSGDSAAVRRRGSPRLPGEASSSTGYGLPPASLRVVASGEMFPRVTRSRRRIEGWKTGATRCGTSTGSPVLGLRAVRALRCRTLKVPKPRISMWSPRAIASFTASRKASTTSPQSFLVTLVPTTSATLSTRSALVMFFSTSEMWPCLVVVWPPTTCGYAPPFRQVRGGVRSGSRRFQPSFRAARCRPAGDSIRLG